MTRSVTSSMSVMVPMTAPSSISGSMRAHLRHLGHAGAVKIARDRQEELVKALGQDPDFAGERVAIVAVDAAIDAATGYRANSDWPTTSRGAAAGLRREPVVPAPDDEVLVGDEDAAIVQLLEPAGDRGAERVELLDAHHTRCECSQSSTARISRSSDATLSTITR